MQPNIEFIIKLKIGRMLLELLLSEYLVKSCEEENGKTAKSHKYLV